MIDFPRNMERVLRALDSEDPDELSELEVFVNAPNGVENGAGDDSESSTSD